MNGIEYSPTLKCRTYNCFVMKYGNMILSMRSKERRLFFRETLKQRIITANIKTDACIFNGIHLTFDIINELIKYNGDEICITEMRTNEEDYLSYKNFSNIQIENPYMDIKWPVRKGENKLSVQATGSGFYLFYNNEKAKRPDGSEWTGPRISLLYDMFYLNGWNIPENLNSCTI